MGTKVSPFYNNSFNLETKTIMKKIFELFKAVSLVTIIAVGFSYCGSEDSGGSSIVNGVNVKNGRKLVKLDIQTESSRMGRAQDATKLKISYDANNRLSKVTWTNGIYYKNGNYVEGETDVMKIDYELKTVTINYGSSSVNYLFSLNDKGYISQISNCTCTYDSYGYLTGVENRSEIWTLAYNEGELIKSLVNNFRNNNIEIYYMFYGEDQRTGDLLFYMNSEKDHSYGRSSTLATMCFIAYQAGLFGKITNHCTYLTKSNETSAILERKNEKNSNKFRAYCSFTFE